MSGEKIGIIGAGNLGQAMAGHLALEGHQVRIQDISRPLIDNINERQGIRLHGAVEGFAPIELASYDVEDVVLGRDLIIVTVPASSHAAVARTMGPFLQSGQQVMLHPGHTLGAFDFHNTLQEMGIETPITLGEIQTALLTCRLTGPAEVLVATIKKHVPLSIFPAVHGFDKAQLLLQVYPTLKAPNVLKTSMDNFNAILHPSVTLLNTGRIDAGIDFLYYWDGFTSAVSNVVEALDAERCEVAKAMGVKPLTLHEFFDTSYETSGEALWEKVHSNQAYGQIAAPKAMNTRLIMEDIPTGLVPIADLGRAFGVPTPLSNAFIDLACAMLKTDFRRNGRTLTNLGLTGMNVDDLHHFAETGKKK